MYDQAVADNAKNALAELTESSEALGSFYLAGGTAAALQLGHRVSVDLDFFSGEDFSAQSLLETVSNNLQISNTAIDKGTLKFQLSQTAISFFHYPYRLINVTSDYQAIDLAHLLDIAAMKITAIASRGSKKDFVDLYYILNEYSLEQVFSAFKSKYKQSEFEEYHFLKSLTYFEDADLDPDPQMLVDDYDWEAVKTRLMQKVKAFMKDLLKESN